MVFHSLGKETLEEEEVWVGCVDEFGLVSSRNEVHEGPGEEDAEMCDTP